MQPTNVRKPDFFHKVVDCQWACPAHTNVPEYIRLIAQGRYSDAYLLNRESNVFPGVLGRTCDRPCEPACRRGRVEEKPVAICRLKRVASDLRDDVSDRLPKAPAQKNGKRIACIGAGPASLAVANDLAPLGYDVTIYEKLPVPGGLMRSNIPAFRLPEKVLTEEIDMILRMGVTVHYDSPITSMKGLLAQGYDAIFVGSGAPRGKNLEVPGRYESDRIHIGIDWLESVAFGHIDRIGERVLIIGVGNTAMDCCRSSRRLGGKDIKVMARKPRGYFKASPWELDDAEEEQVEILVNHEPKRFVIQEGKLVGMEFQRYESREEKGKLVQTPLDVVFLPADDVILAIGQEAAFPWIERDVGIELDKWEMPVVDKVTHQCSRPGVFFGGDAAWGPLNIIWAVEHAHQAAISIHNHCSGLGLTDRPPQGMNLVSTKMGIHEWSYKNDYNPEQAPEDEARRPGRALQADEHRGRDRLHRRADRDRSRAVPQLRHPDGLHRLALHRVRRVRGRVPGAVPDDCPRPRRAGPAQTTERAGDEREAGPLRIRAAAADEARHGEGRGHVRALRTLRGAMSDRGVGHAEIRPAHPVREGQPGGEAGEWPGPEGDGVKSATTEPRVNDFAFKLANVNGTGSASANGLLMQAIFRMGIPVSGKNLFPSNIQGLPTWYEIRVNANGHTARTSEYDLMVAMNAETYARDVREVRSGGWLLYDSSWPLNPALAREDVTFLGVPYAALCNEAFTQSRERTLMKNIAYAGTLAALLDIDMDVVHGMLKEKFVAQARADGLELEGHRAWATTTPRSTSRARSRSASRR